MSALRLKLFYTALLLLTFVLTANGGGSPSGVHSSPPQPSQSHTPRLCSKNPVQCCWTHAESNSVKGQSLLQKLGIKSLPKKPEELGYNCTSVHDYYIREGHCDYSILCCDTIYNGTLHNGTVIKHPKANLNHTAGLGCYDVHISR